MKRNFFKLAASLVVMLTPTIFANQANAAPVPWVYPGSPFLTGDSTNITTCSAGIPVFSTQKQARYFVTARHCFKNTNNIAYNLQWKPIGKVVQETSPNSRFDFVLVELTTNSANALALTQNQINFNESSPNSIFKVPPTIIPNNNGANVCFIGERSDVKCGTTDRTNVLWNVSEGDGIQQGDEESFIAGPGDSGGAVFEPNKGYVGIIIASNKNKSLIQPLSVIITNLRNDMHDQSLNISYST